MSFKTRFFPSKTVFFHVPKTGGTTFQAILAAIYGESFCICSDPSIDSIATALTRFKCLEFHLQPADSGWVCLHTELVRQRRWDLIKGRHAFTMLREPVDQALSQYFYLQTIRARVEPILHASGLDFTDSLTEYFRSPTAYNGQLAFLLGRTQRNETLTTRDDLAKAKEMLVELRMHVGLTERFADAMNVFESVTGERIPDAGIKNQNRNAGRPKVADVPNKIREQIRENSALDIELYEFGRELFLEDLKQCGKTRTYSFLAAAPVGTHTPQNKAASTQPIKRAVFLHVMRTGGRSFRSFLASLYGDSYHVCDDGSLDSVQADLNRFECNVLHTQGERSGYSHTHSQLISQRRWDLLEGTEVFTLLRDPVDHVVSQYYFLVRSRLAAEAIFKAEGTRFPESLEEYLDAPWHRNRQLTFLVGKHVVRSGDSVTSEDLARAMEMLTALRCHIGLTERFADSLNIFGAVMGRRYDGPPLLKIRQNPNRPPLEAIPASMKNRIRAENSLDVDLYEYGKAIFLNDLHRHGLATVDLAASAES
jgi:hypothetical protein